MSPTNDKTLRVLIVEDNLGDVVLVETALRRAKGATVEMEQEGRLSDALGRLATASYDAVLLDLGLPDSHGIETFRRLRKARPTVPVVILSGTMDEELALRAIQEGAQDYLVKGRDPGEVVWRSLRYAVQRVRGEEAQRLAAERLKEIGRLEEINRFKTQLLNTASHELNTPLTPLKLQVQILRESTGPMDDSRRRAFDILDRNVDKLTHLVQNMLDVGRIQSGRSELRKGPTNVSQGVRETIESFSEVAKRSGVILEDKSAGEVWADADTQRVSQVMFNLIDNALKFTPAQGRVVVEAGRNDASILIRVRDTGIGLTPEQIGRMFQPFSQVHERPQTSSRPGTGLGLYISRQIVEMHGGHLWVESPGPGRGSTFSFTLPLTVADSSPRGQRATSLAVVSAAPTPGVSSDL